MKLFGIQRYEDLRNFEFQYQQWQRYFFEMLQLIISAWRRAPLIQNLYEGDQNSQFFTFFAKAVSTTPSTKARAVCVEDGKIMNYVDQVVV